MDSSRRQTRLKSRSGISIAGKRSPLLHAVALSIGLAVASGCQPGVMKEEQTTADAEAAHPDIPKYPVSPVRGESWLRHLGLTIPETRMGQTGGDESASPSGNEPELAPQGLSSIMHRYWSLFRSRRDDAAQLLDEPFTLEGEDLYRLNCQSCHGPDGEGAPPEIKSLIGPIQGTSAELTLERMRQRGTPISESMAANLATQAEGDVRKRLREGGEMMPPFPHLRGDEVDALLGYLQKLAEVPPTKYQEVLVEESAARVGEHMVKGTCHICHDATGPGGGHMAMMRGVIPSLESFPRDQSVSSFLNQVQNGSSPMMGMMGGRGMMGGMGGVPLMPALPFLTHEESAAAYVYLMRYPPQP